MESSSKVSKIFYRPKDDVYRVMFRNALLKEVNAIRRILMSQIETMAIDMVKIIDNQTSIHDEVLVHRLGMLPILITPKKLKDPESCDCGTFCDQCAVLFSLDAFADEDTCLNPILDTDIKIKEKEKFESPKKAQNIPLFFLRNGESLSIEGAIRHGCARMHSKWSLVAAVGIFCPDEIEEPCDMEMHTNVPEGETDVLKDYILQFEVIGTMHGSEIMQKARDIYEQS